MKLQQTARRIPFGSHGDDFTWNKSRIPPLLKRQAWREASSHASDMLVYLAVRKFYHGPSWTVLHGLCILVEFYPASSVILNCFGYFDGCFCFHFSVEFLLFPFPSAFYQSKDGEKCHFPCLSRRSHVLSRHPKRFLRTNASFFVLRFQRWPLGTELPVLEMQRKEWREVHPKSFAVLAFHGQVPTHQKY